MREILKVKIHITVEKGCVDNTADTGDTHTQYSEPVEERAGERQQECIEFLHNLVDAQYTAQEVKLNSTRAWT